MQIGNKSLNSVYIIAEFGVNHGNSLEVAKEGIIAAAKAGAHAIKFQTYTADELVCKGTQKFWDHASADGMDQHEAYEKIGGFPEWLYPEIIKCCEENNIEFLSTPFSFKAAEMLNGLGMKAFKVASSDMSTLPYLEFIAKFNKPILLSTGASTQEEIRQSIKTIQEAGNNQIVLMHCILDYPTKPEDANLETIAWMKKAFPHLPIGYSDHTIGLMGPYIAAYLGATVIEKHFTIDKSLETTADHWFAVDPVELRQMVDNCEAASKMKGKERITFFACEEKTRKYDKRSIVSRVKIPKDTLITEDMITYKRPGTGLWPMHKDLVINAVAQKNIPEDTVIKLEMI